MRDIWIGATCLEFWGSRGGSEGLIVGEEWGPPEEGSGTAARPFLAKMIFFA